MCGSESWIRSLKMTFYKLQWCKVKLPNHECFVFARKCILKLSLCYKSITDGAMNLPPEAAG